MSPEPLPVHRQAPTEPRNGRETGKDELQLSAEVTLTLGATSLLLPGTSPSRPSKFLATNSLFLKT